MWTGGVGHPIAPLKIFSHRDSLYLDASVVRKQGKNKHKPDFNPLLVIHRFKGGIDGTELQISGELLL